MRSDITWKDINIENCEFICIYNNPRIVIDLSNNRLFFENSGEIICELLEGFRIKWNRNVPFSLKRLVKEQVKYIQEKYFL